MRVRLYMRIMVLAREKGWKNVARLSSWRMQRGYGIFVSPLAVFPESLTLVHPTGVVIGRGVVIGEDVRIFQNATLGGARVGDMERQAYPKVGSGVTIFAGAVIVGSVELGDGCIVGANSVVTRSIPAGTVAVGAPARVVRSNSNASE